MGERSLPQFEPQDIEVRDFDPTTVNHFEPGAVERAENENVRGMIRAQSTLEVNAATRARNRAEADGVATPARIHTPNPHHLDGLATDADKYPGTEKGMPDIEIDPEDMFKFN